MTVAVLPVYLDNNATTPADPRVVEAMLPFFTGTFGNPSSVEHAHGHAAQTAVAEARAKVARSLGARDNEIVFTGSCTEANNIAILGAARAQPDRRHVVTTAVEHPAVLEPMRQLAREGHELTILPVDQTGRVDPDDVRRALRDDTLLVSVMGANNEVGTVQPLATIGALCEERGALLHADLAQVAAHGPFDVTASSVHLASLSGHKAYGPKGVGALYARSRGPRARLAAIGFGGGQERGLRSGTLNVPLIVGLAEALSICVREGRAEGARLTAMCTAFASKVSRAVDGVMSNGHPTERIPGNCSLSIAGVEPLALMHRLRGVASFSASSACATDKVETSHVLLAMFGDTLRARQAFRVSPGRFTTEPELDAFADALIEAVGDLRRLAASPMPAADTDVRRGEPSGATDPHAAARAFVEDFGRTEHALKRSGYLRNREVAEADWDRFAGDLGQSFFERVASAGIAPTLIGQPPRRLMADLAWAPEELVPLTDVHQLFANGIRRVRNSYIHGEKFTGGPEGRWTRDLALVTEAHAVLRLATEWLPRPGDT